MWKMQNIEIAVSLVKQAIDQDRRKNYQEAARCYREALNLFDNALKSNGSNKSVKQAIILNVGNQYEKRLGKLEKILLYESKDLSPKDVFEYQYNQWPYIRNIFEKIGNSTHHPTLWAGLASE